MVQLDSLVLGGGGGGRALGVQTASGLSGLERNHVKLNCAYLFTVVKFRVDTTDHSNRKITCIKLKNYVLWPVAEMAFVLPLILAQYQSSFSFLSLPKIYTTLEQSLLYKSILRSTEHTVEDTAGIGILHECTRRCLRGCSAECTDLHLRATTQENCIATRQNDFQHSHSLDLKTYKSLIPIKFSKIAA